MFSKLFSLIAAAAIAVASPLAALDFDTRASSAIVIEQSSGTVLFEKNADVALPPASMSKLMTLNMLFEAIEDGRVSMDTPFAVSTRAEAMGGSTMFLDRRDRPTVAELIQGIIVLSGNDACVAVAEGLAGTEEAFAKQMTERAKDLGMANSSFANASGWPHPQQRMSMHDLAVLADRLITHFPQYYHFFSQTEFGFDGRAPDNRFNRNPLLKLGIGADGLKTGHTSEAGYGLVGSARQGDRRVIFVISGLQSEAARAEEAESIANWAFRQFVQRTVAPAGKILAEAPVWMGAASTVGLMTESDIDILIPAEALRTASAEVVYNGPLEAPISKGQELATLVVTRGDMDKAHIPLVADQDIAAGGFGKRVGTAAQVLFGRLTGDEGLF